MRRTLFIPALLALLAIPLHGRTWKSSDGKEIEAELVRIEDRAVVISMQGKEYTVPLDKLSQADRDFVAEEKAKANRSPLDVLGTTLKPGARTVVATNLSKKTASALDGNQLQPTRMKIAIELPEDFDPAKPQKVFWAVGGINDENERKSGNIGIMDRYAATARGLGWIVIAADTEHGNPRESTVQVVQGDTEFHEEVVARISESWPDFPNWRHACGGHSSGAKGSFFRAAQLRKSGVEVVGLFLSGCNQSLAAKAAEETGLRSSKLGDIKVWISTGTQDELVSPEHTEKVWDGVADGGYGDVVVESFEGGHSIDLKAFGKALDWFGEEN